MIELMKIYLLLVEAQEILETVYREEYHLSKDVSVKDELFAMYNDLSILNSEIFAVMKRIAERDV